MFCISASNLERFPHCSEESDYKDKINSSDFEGFEIDKKSPTRVEEYMRGDEIEEISSRDVNPPSAIDDLCRGCPKVTNG